jgi:hypothetical protein
MWRRFAKLALVAVVAAASVGYWLSVRSDNSGVIIPPPPQTFDEGFDRREAIVAAMLADPRTWDHHLTIAAAILMQNQQMFRAGRLWDLIEVRADARQLQFVFSARQRDTLLAMPEWRGGPQSVGEEFTNNAYQWICQRPETAAIWDVHSMLFAREEISAMTIEIYRSNHGEFLRSIPVELLPCADRYSVSDG